jgi:acetyl-CoA carboxylase biotin carboxyl carrier protein
VTLTAQDVAEITRLLEESQFDELHLEHAGFTLTLRRSAATRGIAADSARKPAAVPAAAALPAVPQAQPLSRGPSTKAGREVRAPLLGSFYRAPKPGAAPYVEVGSAVQEDTIIGIIEVMKLMNTVRAGVAGTVVEILAQDGALIEYGQVLLVISQGTR